MLVIRRNSELRKTLPVLFFIDDNKMIIFTESAGRLRHSLRPDATLYARGGRTAGRPV